MSRFGEDANPYPQLRMWRTLALICAGLVLFLLGVSGLTHRRWNRDLCQLILETCRG